MLDGNVLLRQKRDEVPEGTLSCPDRNLAVFHHYRHYEGLRLLPSVCDSKLIQQTLFRKNPFDKDLPYDNLFCAQMESIMSDGDRLLYEYTSFINLHNLRMNLDTIADEYMLFVNKCNEVLPYVEEWHKEYFANIVVSATKRANFFKKI